MSGTILRVIFLVLLVKTGYSQSPQSFNYQGVARDLAGIPLPLKTISIRITILKGSPTGSESYKEIHQTTTNPLGLFTLQIGQGTIILGSFSSIEWGTAAHFVQIEIDANGGSDYQYVGTSPLLSVPYALYASNGSKWKSNGSNIYYNNAGFVGIGTDTPTSNLDVQGANQTRISIAEGNSASFGGYFPFVNLVAKDDINSQMTLIPSRFTEDEPALQFGFSGSQGAARNFVFRANNSDLLFIKGTGNVGIGTSFPKSKLQVSAGDIFLDDSTKGIIMKSPNGSCWRTTVANDGKLTTTLVQCPN